MHGYPWIRSIPDFSKWDGSKFRTMMQDSVSTYRGRAASTADFRAIVAKHMGEDMGWFFDQWVYGTEIPTNQGTWSVEREGQAYQLHLKVLQKGVTEHFRAVLPIRVRFDKGYLALHVTVEGPAVERAIKVAKEPKDVEFDFFDGVLAR